MASVAKPGEGLVCVKASKDFENKGSFLFPGSQAASCLQFLPISKQWYNEKSELTVNELVLCCLASSSRRVSVR